MQPIDILMEEHRVIERVLDALEIAAKNLSAGRGGSPEFFLKAADFIRGFADGCHHKKEEGVLFEALIAQGFSKEMGPVAVMLAEHEQGRQLTRAMQEGAAHLQAADNATIILVAQSALGYVDLLRRHIQKEDNVLFPMANQMIPAAQNESILAAFAHITQQDNAREKYLRIAAELEQSAATV